jgi:neutral ceramidase
MDAVEVAPELADGQPHRTCPAAIGVSMLAGAEDGRGVGYEGFGCAPPANLFERAVCAVAADDCQGAKPIALTMGSKDPPWSPPILPFTVARVGGLGIVAAPFELTTMAGRRVIETARAALAPAGVDAVVVAGLANAYAGYVATPEEYAAQHYEGASTHFGPWTLGAVRQTVAALAAALRDGQASAPGPSPRDPAPEPWSLHVGVLFDAVPLGTAIGAVERPPASGYRRGETASAQFWGGHPLNDLQRGGTFLEVQRRDGDAWRTVARDHDWETRFRWERSRCLPTLLCSLVTVEWDIPADAAPGTYRLLHRGHWKPMATRVVEPYEGASGEFAVE